MKATIRGTQLYFDIAGAKIKIVGNKLVEKPVLFLLHGGPGGNHINFRLHANQLQAHAQLVYLDQRGCGWSKQAKHSEQTLENNIEDLEALRKYLGFKKIAVLGASYGGIIAQGYAIRYPKQVSHLILVATAPSHQFIDEAKQNIQKIGSKKQIAICNKYLWHGKFKSDKDVQRYFDALEPLYHPGKKPKGKASPVFKSKTHDNKFSYKALNAGFGGFLHHFNFIPHLAKIRSPSLVLAGQYDWICSPAQSRIMARMIPNARLKVFRKCGHAVMTDANDKFLKEVSRFLRLPAH